MDKKKNNECFVVSSLSQKRFSTSGPDKTMAYMCVMDVVVDGIDYLAAGLEERTTKGEFFLI